MGEIQCVCVFVIILMSYTSSIENNRLSFSSLCSFFSLPPRPDLYTSKRMLATNIGSAFMEILGLFKGSLSLDEKKKIASDMTNESVGHMVRGRFCTSVAMLLLDGVKLQKLGGLIQYDVWKLVTSFCQEGMTNHVYDLGRCDLTLRCSKFRPLLCFASANNLTVVDFEAW